MPFGDGTGPRGGAGPGTGRGMGRGRGTGGGRGSGGGNRPGSGPGGACVCPKCGYHAPHAVGTPCYDLTCPTCGVQLVKE